MMDHQRTVSWRRRSVIAAAVLGTTVLALLAAVVIIAPKVINSGEVRSRIEAVVAKELRGTMTYDRVELALLPSPDVVLHGLTIDLPGSLSAMAAQVRVRARLLPLFRGQFRVSSVALVRPVLTLTLPSETAARRTRRQPAPKPAGGSVDEALAIAGRELPDLSFKISRGRITLARDGRSFLSLTDLDTSLAFVPDGAGGRSSPGYHVVGSARTTLSEAAVLPAPLAVSIERLDAAPDSLSIKNARARLQDLDASFSADLQGYLSGFPRSDIQARGTIGPDTLFWLQTIAGLPDSVSLRAPLSVTGARLRSAGTGSAASRSLTLTAKKDGGTVVSLALRQEPGLFSIDSLRVKDNDSDAEMRFSRGADGLALSFAGNLAAATIGRVLESGRFSSGWLTGDLQARLPHGRFAGASIQGKLEGGQFSVPVKPGLPVAIDRITANAGGTVVDLRPSVFSLGQNVLQTEGTASLSEDGVELDLDVASDRIDLTTLRTLLEKKQEDRPAANRPGQDQGTNISGRIRLHIASFLLDRHRADALEAQVTFGSGRTAAILEHATICEITVTGSMQTADGAVELTLTPHARGMQLGESLPCIFNRDLKLSGTYDLSGQFSGRGTWDTLLRSLGGSFALSASGGRIQSDNIVKGVITYLNSTSLLKGSRTDLLKEGVPYETIAFRGTLHDGTLSLSEAVIKGRDLHLAAEGNIGLRDGTLALDVLAAPFTQLDRLLSSVPLVKHLVGNALIIVPARVEGTFEHPKVRPLAVSGVGKNVTNLMKNTVQAPMKIIEPALPEELEGEKARRRD